MQQHYRKLADGSTYMLVDKQNGNVLALVGEAIKGGFDGRRLGLAVHNQKVLLAIWRLGNVLYHLSVFYSIATSGESYSIRLRPRATCPCKCPANSQSASPRHLVKGRVVYAPHRR